MSKILRFVKFKNLWRFLPFWIFLILFKFGGDLHFDSMSPLGERVLPIWIVGIVIGLASLLQLVLDVPAGFLLDKYGYKKLLKITTLVFIFAASFLFLGLNQYTYILTLMLGCFGWLFYGPGVNAYALSHAPKEEAGRFMSLRDAFDSLGVVIASLAFTILINFPVQIIAGAVIAILIVAYISISLAPEDFGVVHAEKKLPTQNYYIKRQFLHKVVRAIFKLNPASLMLLLSGLSSSIFYSIIWFVVPLVIAHAENPGVMSWGLGIFDLAIVFTGFIVGRLANKINRKLLVFFGLLTFAIMGMFLGFNFGLLFVLIGFIAAVGDEIAHLSLWSWLYALDKDHAEDGLVSGVVNLFQDLGWTIGPIIGGFLYYGLGPSWTILVGGIFILITWCIYTFKLNASHSIFDLKYDSIPKKPHRSRNGR